MAKPTKKAESYAQWRNPAARVSGKGVTLRNMASATIKRLPGGAVAVTGRKLGGVGRANPGGSVRSGVIRERPGAASVALRLRLDSDGAYRWFEASGSDTEVSGRTIADAVKAARSAWRSWEFRLKK